MLKAEVGGAKQYGNLSWSKDGIRGRLCQMVALLDARRARVSTIERCRRINRGIVTHLT